MGQGHRKRKKRNKNECATSKMGRNETSKLKTRPVEGRDQQIPCSACRNLSSLHSRLSNVPSHSCMFLCTQNKCSVVPLVHYRVGLSDTRPAKLMLSCITHYECNTRHRGTQMYAHAHYLVQTLHITFQIIMTPNRTLQKLIKNKAAKITSLPSKLIRFLCNDSVYRISN